jgi:tetratricopeptide (TPR) repeat protein
MELLRSIGTTIGTDKTIASYRELVRLVPSEFSSWYELGILLQTKNDHRGALKAFQSAIKSDTRPLPASDSVGPTGLSLPGSIRMRIALGFSLRESGDLIAAEQEYQKAMKQLDEKDFRVDKNEQPLAAKVTLGLTTCLIRQNKIKEAMTLCEEFVRRTSVNLPKPSQSDTPVQAQAARKATEHLVEATTKIAHEFLRADRWTETVEWSDRAIRQLQDYSKKWAGGSKTTYKVDVALPHHLKAIALNWLGNGKEAVAAIDESIRLSSPKNKPYQRMMRARYVAKTGDHVEAAKLVKAELSAGNTNTWDAALAYSLCVKAATGDEKLQEYYAKEAVAMLKKTLDAKGFNYPWRGDPDLNPIRNRTDFKAVLAELEKLSSPKP